MDLRHISQFIGALVAFLLIVFIWPTLGDALAANAPGGAFVVWTLLGIAALLQVVVMAYNGYSFWTQDYPDLEAKIAARRLNKDDDDE